MGALYSTGTVGSSQEEYQEYSVIPWRRALVAGASCVDGSYKAREETEGRQCVMAAQRRWKQTNICLCFLA